MKVGDLVRHKRKGWIGTVLEISTRTTGVLVDLSDEKGVMCRVINRKDLEKIKLV